MRRGWSAPSLLCNSQAMTIANCGTVIAGVHFFPPSGFLNQKPGGDESQCLMMMSPFPGSHLIVGQTCLSLGTLQAFLNAVLGLGHSDKLRQRRLPRGDGQVVIVLPTSISLPLPDYYQGLLRTDAASIHLGLHARFHGLHYQRPFLPVAHVDCRQSFFRQNCRPVLHPPKWHLRPRPSTAIRRRCSIQMANQGSRGHGQQILLVPLAQSLAKLTSQSATALTDIMITCQRGWTP